MGRKGFFVDRHAVIGSIWRQAPALQSVPQVRDHNLVQHLAVHRLVFYRYKRLDASIKISRHPVGRADENLGPVRGQLLPIGKADDAAMLEEAADDAFYPDIFRKTRDPGSKAADSADHQVDGDPRF